MRLLKLLLYQQPLIFTKVIATEVIQTTHFIVSKYQMLTRFDRMVKTHKNFDW